MIATKSSLVTLNLFQGRIGKRFYYLSGMVLKKRPQRFSKPLFSNVLRAFNALRGRICFVCNMFSAHVRPLRGRGGLWG